MVVPVVASAAQPTPAPVSCTFAAPKLGASFDLSPLQLGRASSYSVKDDIDSSQRNYTYYFGVCGTVPLPDTDCPVDAFDPTRTAPAYQVSNDQTACFRLAQSPYVRDVEWALLAANDPSVGVQLTYKNGDKCNEQPRSLTLRFVCSATARCVCV